MTEQYYLRAKYYNPVIARFTQEDTYYGDGLNLYTYCQNNPILYHDPTGHGTKENSPYSRNEQQYIDAGADPDTARLAAECYPDANSKKSLYDKYKKQGYSAQDAKKLANREIIHGEEATKKYIKDNNVKKSGPDYTATSPRDNVNTDWRTQERLKSQNKGYSGDMMSSEDAARYSEYWRRLGIGSEETWKAYLNSNPMGNIDDYFEIVQKQSPWPIGYTPQKVTLKAGDTFEMALGVGQPVTQPGRFATTTNTITNVDYVRNDLAVKREWKPDIDRVVTYQVKGGMKLSCLQGPVGPQIDLNTNTYLPGGAQQINILLDRNTNAMDYFTPISIRNIE